MSSIDIEQNHSLGRDKAKEAAEKVAARLKEKVEVEYEWNGDVLEFKRSGASGTIELDDDKVRVKAQLGLMLRPMKGMIESKIREYLGKYLS